jgi:hypothetical protein
MLALLAGSALGLTDCKKNSEPAPDNRSQQEIWLTGTGWNMQFISQVLTSGGVATTGSGSPASYGFPRCTLDDITHYNRDRTVTVDEGPLQCQPPATGSTWDFAANETEIVTGSSSTHYKIVSLTATTLQLERTVADPGGTTIVQTTTYAAR